MSIVFLPKIKTLPLGYELMRCNIQLKISWHSNLTIFFFFFQYFTVILAKKIGSRKEHEPTFLK